LTSLSNHFLFLPGEGALNVDIQYMGVARLPNRTGGQCLACTKTFASFRSAKRHYDLVHCANPNNVVSWCPFDERPFRPKSFRTNFILEFRTKFHPKNEWSIKFI
jgi:hypothetical protein